MKFLNKIIGLCVILFLFFTFSNFNSINELFQSFSNSNAEQKTKKESNFEKVIVSEIIDGDTIKVELSNGEIETIRLLLVDTPETVKPDTPVQPFGKEASNYMKKTLIKDTVVEIERGIEERDKYGRLLAYVWQDGTNINKELLKKGFARLAYVYEPNTKYVEDFKKAEQEARKDKKGIWSIDGYVDQEGFYYP